MRSEKQIAQLENQISETQVTLKYQAIRAPKDGLIFDLQASSPGYVVNSERPILNLYQLTVLSQGFLSLIRTLDLFVLVKKQAQRLMRFPITNLAVWMV